MTKKTTAKPAVASSHAAGTAPVRRIIRPPEKPAKKPPKRVDSTKRVIKTTPKSKSTIKREAIAMASTNRPIEPMLPSTPNSPALVVLRARSSKDHALNNAERKALAALCKTLTPLEFAQSVLLDEGAAASDRRWAAELIMPYMHRKLPTAVSLEPSQNFQAGVLVAPASMSAEEWIAAYANPRPDNITIDAEDVELTPFDKKKD